MLAANEVIGLTNLSTSGLEYIARNSGYSQTKLMNSEFIGLNIDCNFVYKAYYIDMEGEHRSCKMYVSLKGGQRILHIEE
jgi:hypothetical protein